MARSPAFTLIVDGQDLSPKVKPRLMSLTLTEKRGDEADQLDLVISDHDGKMGLPRRGALISLSLGWRDQGLVGKGRFKVDELEWNTSPAQITIRARSADLTADLRIRRERSWRGATLQTVLEDIAGAAGLGVSIDPTLAARSAAVLEQSRESDVAFLRRLGKTYDATATVKAGQLIFAPIGASKTATGKPLAAVEILASDGDGASWKVADRGTYKGVTASWHSTADGKKHKVTAGEAAGARRLRKTYASEADARQAVDAEWNRIARGAGSLTYTLALGRPDLAPETKIRIKGLKAEIDATTWLISQVTHSLTDGGLVTAIEMETGA